MDLRKYLFFYLLKLFIIDTNIFFLFSFSCESLGVVVVVVVGGGLKFIPFFICRFPPIKE